MSNNHCFYRLCACTAKPFQRCPAVTSGPWTCHSRAKFGPFGGYLEGILAPFRAMLGSLWGLLVLLGTVLGKLLGQAKKWKKTAGSAAILGHLGPSWGHLGAILGPSWGHLGPSWGFLGPSWGHLGAILKPS